MKVIAFHGSPRKGGNSELLLNETVRGVEEMGHTVTIFRPGEMDISPCTNCGGCNETGECIIKDDMEEVYKAIREGDRFIVSSPLFFFALTAQIKALIDRCQAFWCEKYLLRRPIPAGPHGRRGLLLLVGGMKREIGFKCGDATATAFFRTISVSKHKVLSYRQIDAAGAIKKHPTALGDAFEEGKRLVSGGD
ncbi:iron-sulfur flavoprotein [bacterium BMS3Abin07]|nr:iron-sulfur flavoprotein [bacterium BMS3Abin07]GBE33430.1 iron-sulfur flavoprotein [bacterium BMS3Bbin05]HDL21048.1 flavodoxin family protein [Nitrospirota bacterium]HDO21256.1 flavodoxin family protein [Nitrospirota bacterium]HDZ87847.1 flavodoxin family protein [Nitrospirota bacterium]